MITLYKTRDAWGTPDLSPFCIKLESYLRMAGLPYQIGKTDFRKMPKGKVPYVDIDGVVMGDSQLIIEYLKGKMGDKLDANLTAEERATGHAVRRMLEEATYFIGMYYRWVADDGFAVLRPIFLSLLPPVFGALILGQIRKKLRGTLQAQGTGRHSEEEIAAMGKADLDALSVLLGEKPFLLGDEPTSVDATVYAFLVSTLSFPVDSPLRQKLKQTPNLVQYIDRFRARYWADWQPKNPA